MAEWHVEEFDPTWHSNMKWAYDQAREQTHIWKLTKDGDGSHTHRDEASKLFGRKMRTQDGDKLGLATFIPEEKKTTGESVVPAHVIVQAYYGAIIPQKIYDHFKAKFPDAIVRQGIRPATASFQPDFIIDGEPVLGPSLFPELDGYLTKEQFDKFAADWAKKNWEVSPVLVSPTEWSLWSEKASPSLSVTSSEPVKPTIPTKIGRGLRRFLKLEEPSDWGVQVVAGADMQGAMVALYLPEEIGEKLQIADGEPVDRMHITLLYFENKAEERDDWDEVVELLMEQERQPLKGTIGGYGVFTHDDGDVLWASVNVPGLMELKYELTKALEEKGFSENKEHGFTPHVTLKYDFKGKLPKLDAPIDVEFKDIYFVRGDDKEEVTLQNGI